MKPHEYQSRYLQSIAEGWGEHDKLLVVSPTGSGKGPMFAWTAEPFVKAGKRALLLVDQDELVKQGVNKFREVLGIQYCGIEKAASYAETSDSVVVASVQSLMREKRLERWPKDNFGIVLCDEADKSLAPSWMRVLKHFDGHAKVCGYTATPWRTDQRNMGEYYENVIEHENLRSLITKGFLSPITIEQTPIKIDVSGKGAGKDFTDDEADEIITPHLEEIARQILEKCSFRRTLVFLPLIKTCERFNEIARDVGLSADYIYGEDPDRDDKLKRFRAWDFDVLANSMLLTRGVDIPAVDAIVPCRPTKSVTLYFQMCGRGTRLAPGKTDCLLLDFLYLATKRLICRPAHLIAKNAEEADEITKLCEAKAGLPADVASQLDLLTVAANASSQREEALRKKLEEQRNKKAQLISYDQMSVAFHDMSMADYEPVTAIEAGPVSEKQLKWLKKIKIEPHTGKIFLDRAPQTAKLLDVDSIRTVGHADQILKKAFDKKNRGIMMASFAVRQKMRQMGRDNWEHATEKEGRDFFVSLRKSSKEPSFI